MGRQTTRGGDANGDGHGAPGSHGSGLKVARHLRSVPDQHEALERELGEAASRRAWRREERQTARLRTAIEQLAEAVIITDTRGNIEYVNPAFEAMSGYSSAETLGRQARHMRSGRHDEASFDRLWDTLRRGEVWRGRIVNKRKDGSAYEVDSTISPVRDTDGRIQQFVAVQRDMTREVELEAQLRQAQRLEAIGRLAGGVAHDFNNVLTVIGTYGSLVLQELPPDSPAREDMGIIQEATRRAATLTSQLLAAALELRPKRLPPGNRETVLVVEDDPAVREW